MWQLCVAMMSWECCLTKDSKLFILFDENNKILLKISVIPLLLSFIYLLVKIQLWEVLIKNYFVTDVFPPSNVWVNPRLNLKYLAPSPQVQFMLVVLMKTLMAFRFWPKVIAKPAAKRKILFLMLMRKSHVKIWTIAGQFSA